MTTNGCEKNRKKKSGWHLEKGKIYFSKTAEQRFFFTLTGIMLIVGIMYKFGFLN